jgi:hypothetical protein
MKSVLKRCLLTLALIAAPALAFDQHHQAWTTLLKRHVAWQQGGHESRVSYAGFANDRPALTAYLESTAAVGGREFEAWNKAERLAFLINVYNARTVELILTRYPDLKSIRDIGSVFNSPWKQRFFTLLGKRSSLDDIEHGMIRAKGAYDDPRIHFAVNCASIGCPALRDEAYVADRLDEQLEDQLTRFLSDHSRNRFEPQSRWLAVSRIFDWYGEDFARGNRGWKSLPAFFAAYAKLLSDDAAEQKRVRDMQAPIKFLEYDWALNGR